MKQRSNNDSGSSKALLLGGAALLLLAVVAVLLYSLGGGKSDEEKALEAKELKELEEMEGGGEGQGRIPGQAWRGKEAPARVAKSFRRLGSVQSELDDQLKAGSKTEEEMDKKYSGPPMDVAIQGPKDNDPRAPELYEKMKKEYLAKIADCYKQSLSSKPSLRGRLNLSLTVKPTKDEAVGQVQASVGQGSTIQDMKLSACVTRRVSRMTVPGIYATEQKGTVFEYPLQLDPGEISAAAPLEPPPVDNIPDPDTPEGKALIKAAQAKATAEANKAPPAGKPKAPPEGHDDPDSPNYIPQVEPKGPPPEEHQEPPPEELSPDENSPDEISPEEPDNPPTE